MIIPPIRKTYKDQVVLDLPELRIPDGCILAVCGQNGSGKSTLARILAGIIDADNIKDPLAGLRVGYMAQRSLAFKMSVRNNLLLNADPSRPRSENLERAAWLMKALGIDNAARKNAQKLSGGQIQRMSLARSLMKPYDMLLLDEPTASMDQTAIPAAEELMLDYHRSTGCTLLLISHSPEQISRMTDLTILLEKGKLLSAPPQW